MIRPIFISLFLILPCLSNASELNGNFICDVTMNSEGSGGQDVLVIQENTMKIKTLGFDDAWFSNYTFIHKEKVNPFKTFVMMGDHTKEDLVKVSVRARKNTYHYSQIFKSKGWKPNERFAYGIFKKL